MNVGGLNNLGLSQASPKGEAGKVTPQKGEHSFERALNQAQAKAPTKLALHSSRSEETKAEKNAGEGHSSENSSSGGEERSQDNAPKTLVATASVKSNSPADAKAEPSTEKNPSEPSSAKPTVAAPPLKATGEDEAFSNAALKAEDDEDADAQVAIVKASIAAFMAPQKAAAPLATSVKKSELKANSEVAPQDPEKATEAIWNHFLEKMNDLGVNPEKVLHAFASLNKKEMAQSPEQSVDKLVLAMGLTGAQAAIAKKEFLQVVRKTQELDADFAPLSREVAVTAQLAARLQMAAPASSALTDDDLSREVPQEEVATPAAAKGAASAGAAPFFPTPAAAKSPSAASLVKPMVATPASPSASAVNSMMERLQPADGAQDDKQIEALVRNLNSAPLKTNSALPQNPAAIAEAQAPTAAVKVSAPPATQASAAGLAAAGLFAAGDDKKQNQSGDDSSGRNESAATLNAALANEAHNANSAKGDFQAHLKGAATPAATLVPMQEIVQKAQVMVREGGGDMKVTVRPDGLGEISMKVSVTNGKVSVQMMAQTDEARKLLERQIGELKTGLTANHLQVESIKVDSSAAASKHFDQNFQDSQRQQQAQASLEQFRQDASGGRRGFSDHRQPGNPYRTGSELKSDVKGFNLPRPNPSLGSRRLDLVA